MADKAIDFLHGNYQACFRRGALHAATRIFARGIPERKLGKQVEWAQMLLKDKG